MGALEITLAVLLGLVVNEVSDVSPWLARWLVRWSARLRYGDTDRAGVRAEELAAVINDRPGKLFKLGTGLRFVSAALVLRFRRLATGERTPFDETVPEELFSMRRPFADAEPSRVVAQYLFPTEKFRGEWRRHWIHPVKSVLLIATYAVLCSLVVVQRFKSQYVAPAITVVVTVAVLLAAYRFLGWYTARFVITNKRLMAAQGVLMRRVAMIPLVRVTDMRYVQYPLGRLLNYGNFRLESAGIRSSMRKIVDLPNPNELYLRLVEEMYEPEAVEQRLGRTEYEADDDDDERQAQLALMYVNDQLKADMPATMVTDEQWPLLPLDDDLIEDHYGPDRFRLAQAPHTEQAMVRQDIVAQMRVMAEGFVALAAALERLEVPQPQEAPVPMAEQSAAED